MLLICLTHCKIEIEEVDEFDEFEESPRPVDTKVDPKLEEEPSPVVDKVEAEVTVEVCLN